ncbi:MAG: 16S rRNA (cytosine(967)-C(5))-methyltransferase RsmB [Rhodospirillaceae bacterium]|nr:16S rRNA (cytosine(967)-C(5))-methyltransferase RsmB [Rhodospirillaceae bacterium]
MPRNVAVEIIETVLDRKRTLDIAEKDVARFADLSSRDRALCIGIVKTTLRHLGEIDALIDAYLEKPLGKKSGSIRHIIRSGLAQFLFMGIPEHAAVSETVDLCVGSGGMPYKKLVNAILRRATREGRALLQTLDAAKINTPPWLWERWVTNYGEPTARAIATTHMDEPPLDLAIKNDAPLWAEKLSGQFLPTGAVRIRPKGLINEIEGFAEGAWWIQDTAAQLPVRLLGNVSELDVIDLCAAPGGKTMELAALGARVTAVDRSEKRLERVKQNLERTGLFAKTIAGDAATWRPDHLADMVLLDAPCSSSGTIRRHPDIAYTKSANDIASLAIVQQRLLEASIEMVKPGGLIVYCTCSLEPEEGEMQISELLKNNSKVVEMPVTKVEAGGFTELLNENGQLRTLPCHMAEIGGMDGFFAARLRKI